MTTDYTQLDRHWVLTGHDLRRALRNAGVLGPQESSLPSQVLEGAWAIPVAAWRVPDGGEWEPSGGRALCGNVSITGRACSVPVDATGRHPGCHDDGEGIHWDNADPGPLSPLDQEMPEPDGDPEIAVIAAVAAALDILSRDACRRVLQWASARYVWQDDDQ